MLQLLKFSKNPILALTPQCLTSECSLPAVLQATRRGLQDAPFPSQRHPTAFSPRPTRPGTSP